MASSQNNLGFMAWLTGDSASAETLCTEALAHFRRAGNLQNAAWTLINLGAGALYRGELELSAERLEEALTISRRLGFREGIAWSLHELAIVNRRRGRPTREQAPMLRDALLVHRQLGDRWRTASVLEEVAGSLLARKHRRLAVETLAFADVLREQLATPIPPVEAPDRDATLARLEAKLSAQAYASAWNTGRRRDIDQAVDLVVRAIDHTVRARARISDGI